MIFGYQIYWIIILFGHFTAPLFTLQPQATTPSIYLHTHAVLALAIGFQTFSPSPTYILEKSRYLLCIFVNTKLMLKSDISLNRIKCKLSLNVLFVKKALVATEI